MKHLNKSDKIEIMNHTYVAFGSFDGVHKGHAAVLKKLAEKGKTDGKVTIAVSCYSSADTETGILSTEEEKAYYIEETGIDYLISYDMEQDQLSDDQFIRQMIMEKLGAELIIMGAHDERVAIAQAAGCTVLTVAAERFEEELITAELVRKYFMECRFEEVTQVCGHTYVMIGEVVHGKALGRTVGMPTANLGVSSNKLKPPSGVYATRTLIEDECYQGLTNIGTRPSVDDLPVITIETFLLDFAKDIYGKKLIMEVHMYIRGVRKFNCLEEVQNQVQTDLEQVKDYLCSIA